MEINDVYVDLQGKIWAIKEVDDTRLILTDPYGVVDDISFNRITFEKVLKVKPSLWKIGWTAEESKKWR